MYGRCGDCRRVNEGTWDWRMGMRKRRCFLEREWGDGLEYGTRDGRAKGGQRGARGEQNGYQRESMKKQKRSRR